MSPRCLRMAAASLKVSASARLLNSALADALMPSMSHISRDRGSNPAVPPSRTSRGRWRGAWPRRRRGRRDWRRRTPRSSSSSSRGRACKSSGARSGRSRSSRPSFSAARRGRRGRPPRRLPWPAPGRAALGGTRRRRWGRGSSSTGTGWSTSSACSAWTKCTGGRAGMTRLVRISLLDTILTFSSYSPSAYPNPTRLPSQSSCSTLHLFSHYYLPQLSPRSNQAPPHRRRDVLVDLVQDLCIELEIGDPTVLPAAVARVQRAARDVPRLTQFVDEACEVAFGAGGRFLPDGHHRGNRSGLPGEAKGTQWYSGIGGNEQVRSRI